MEEQKRVQHEPLTYYVRQTRFILLSNTILITVSLIISFILIGVILSLLNSYFNGTIPTMKIMTGVTLFFLLFGIFVVLKSVLNWKSTYYTIRPREFTIHRGLLTKNEEKYELNSVEKINIIQGFFGKMFNYGSIDISNPISGNICRINNISDPFKFEKILLQPPITGLEDPINFIPSLKNTSNPFNETNYNQLPQQRK